MEIVLCIVNDVKSRLQPNECQVVRFYADDLQETTTLEGTLYNIRYSSDRIIILGAAPNDAVYSMASLSVVSPVKIAEDVPLELALPANQEKLMDYCKLKALAYFTLSQRKPGWDVSSYKALLVNGLSSSSAVNYVICKSGMRKRNGAGLSMDTETPEVTYNDVATYMAGDPDNVLSEEASDLIDKILAGITNVDNTDLGVKKDAEQNIESTYMQLYVIHKILGVSIEDIYDEVKKINNESTTIKFGGTKLPLYYTMDVRPIRMSLNGWRRDVANYTKQRVEQCGHFIYVLRVAGEVAEDVPLRHVGMEFLMVSHQGHKDVADVLYAIQAQYKDLCEQNIADEKARNNAISKATIFSFRAFMELYLQGTITLPAAELPGIQFQVNPDWIAVARKRVELKIDSLEAYCSLAANVYNSDELFFTSFCVNAYVTPDCVIPSNPNLPIPMVPIYALWYDWGRMNPPVRDALIAKGVITPEYVPWSLRYDTQGYRTRNLDQLYSEDSLLTYIKKSEEELATWPANKVFHSTTHPSEYNYPGLVSEEDANTEKLLTPRTGVPAPRIGAGKLLRYEDFMYKLNPVHQLPAPDTYIKKFTGFSIESLLYVPDALDKLPHHGEALTIEMSSGSVYVPDTSQVMHFTNITGLDANKYAISHLYDRIWLIRGTDGQYWEVRV